LNSLSNIRAIIDKKDGKEVTEPPLGEWWLSQRERRQYASTTLAPGAGSRVDGRLTLWEPPTLSDRGGKRMLGHIYRVMASRDRASFRYIVRWLAYKLQNPHAMPETVLAFRGKKGAGNASTRAARRIYGLCSSLVSSPKAVI
jgi:hypothetical protein